MKIIKRDGTIVSYDPEKIRKEIEGSKKHQQVSDETGKNIIPLDKLDAFIERMSDVNLEEYMTKE